MARRLPATIMLLTCWALSALLLAASMGAAQAARLRVLDTNAMRLAVTGADPTPCSASIESGLCADYKKYCFNNKNQQDCEATGCTACTSSSVQESWCSNKKPWSVIHCQTVFVPDGCGSYWRTSGCIWTWDGSLNRNICICNVTTPTEVKCPRSTVVADSFCPPVQ